MFLRPVVNMCVVAGTFFVLHGHVDDAGVRGAIAWTPGPVMVELFRSALARRASEARTPEAAAPQTARRARRCSERIRSPRA